MLKMENKAGKAVGRARLRVNALGLQALAIGALAVAFNACGSSDENDDDVPQGGAAGAAGAGGAPRAGAGSGGMDAGAGGAPQAGEAGQAGEGATGGVPSEGGAGGAPDPGSAGAGEGGAGTAGTGAGGSDAGAGAGGSTPVGGGGAGGEGGALPAFSCEEWLAGGEGGAENGRCYDFSDPADDDDFTPEGGDWAARNGEYVGTGPAARLFCLGAAPQDGTWMTASLLDDFTAGDVRMHVRMAGQGTAADKVIVVRARDSENRVELNFRANFGSPVPINGGDLSVQEMTDCVTTWRLEPDTISIPHGVNEQIDVELELRGENLQVWVNGVPAFDNVLTGVTTEAGAVGLAVFINNSSIRFDDFAVESLD